MRTWFRIICLVIIISHRKPFVKTFLKFSSRVIQKYFRSIRLFIEREIHKNMNNSAMRVLEILELFASAPEPLTVSDITRLLGYPKTSVFDIVNILAERGFIKRDNERAKTYVIGPTAYQVGMSYLA